MTFGRREFLLGAASLVLLRKVRPAPPAQAAPSLFPTGTVLPFSGLADPPDGWLLCDGRSLSRTRYRKLYEALGHAYGGRGSRFRVPNLRGSVPVTSDARPYRRVDYIIRP